MVFPYKINYKPKGILIFIIAIGFMFLLIGGILIPYNTEQSNYFITGGIGFLVLSFIVWFAYITPVLVKKVFKS